MPAEGPAVSRAAEEPSVVAPEKRSAALLGMMGAGKSTVGALLAERLGWTFYDTDLLLEAAFGMPIARIFKAPGEAVFRAAEERLVRTLMGVEGAVLAVGGGLWMSAAARRVLAGFAYTAYLAVPLDVLSRRLEQQGLSRRPLLDTARPNASLERLLREREPVYALADWRIDAAREPEAIVQQVVRNLRSVGLVARRGAAA